MLDSSENLLLQPIDAADAEDGLRREGPFRQILERGCRDLDDLDAGGVADRDLVDRSADPGPTVRTSRDSEDGERGPDRERGLRRAASSLR
jgi:hypothetical protein